MNVERIISKGFAKIESNLDVNNPVYVPTQKTKIMAL